MSKFCTTCGTPLQPDQNVCPNCGTPANQTVQQQANYQQYPPNSQAPGNYGTMSPYTQKNGNSSLKIALIVLAAVLGVAIIGLLVYLLGMFVGKSDAKDVYDKGDTIAVNQQVQMDRLQQEQEKIKETNDSLKQALEEEKSKPKTVVKKVESRDYSVNSNMASKVIIAGDNVCLRSIPDESGKMMGSSNPHLNTGEMYDYLGTVGDYYEISYYGESYYIPQQYGRLR
ncbi:zinc-ribbon domain-containing protein [Pseudoprevotella muciniphila]|uniref:Zinc-ribbon domain-containing protein n=1 Tax=Pseudoprevotella muciniphila TaxID=2133944 RepID=A0A5P8E706_9BACT|nr:zinc-ribbon domain-containing protein [Pseudoprevotella muciniphila]QFQ12743.1 zinc-ribbon domain-containing protein [Pseudoprevotella muciniphila]